MLINVSACFQVDAEPEALEEVTEQAPVESPVEEVTEPVESPVEEVTEPEAVEEPKVYEHICTF